MYLIVSCTQMFQNPEGELHVAEFSLQGVQKRRAHPVSTQDWTRTGPWTDSKQARFYWPVMSIRLRPRSDTDEWGLSFMHLCKQWRCNRRALAKQRLISTLSQWVRYQVCQWCNAPPSVIICVWHDICLNLQLLRNYFLCCTEYSDLSALRHVGWNQWNFIQRCWIMTDVVMKLWVWLVWTSVHMFSWFLNDF